MSLARVVTSAAAVPPAGFPPAGADSVEVLKEDRVSRVERLSAKGRSWVRKTYAPAPFFRWRTFLVRSKAAREYANLRALHAAGVPVIEALAWDETRRFGCVPRCSLWLADAGRVDDLKAAFPAADPMRRRRLARAFGGLLRRLHAAGFLSMTAYPRNVLVTGADDAALLWCDQPYLLRRRPLRTGAGVDLYDALFTAGRRAMLSRGERWRALLAYCDGDGAAARAWWRRLDRRPRWLQRFCKGWIKIGGNLGVWARRP